jgi:hypothetical protein
LCVVEIDFCFGSSPILSRVVRQNADSFKGSSYFSLHQPQTKRKRKELPQIWWMSLVVEAVSCPSALLFVLI